MEKEIGKVTHYFDKAMVAVIKVSDKLKVGDTVKFAHALGEFTQQISSMQVDHKNIDSVKAGDEVAIKVDQATHESAKVFKIE